MVSDSPSPPRLASYTGDHVECGRSEEGIQGETGYGACLLFYTLVQLGENPSCLPLAYTLADVPSPPPLLCKTDHPK